MNRDRARRLFAAPVGQAIAAVLTVWLSLAAAAWAQEPASGEAAATAEKLVALTPEERTNLIALLTDTQVRDLLLHYLDRGAPVSAAAGADQNPILEQVEAKGALIRRNAVAAAAAFDDIPEAFGTAYGGLAGANGPLGILALGFFLALFVGAGRAVEWLYSAAAMSVRDSVRARGGPAGSDSFAPAMLTVVLDLLAIIAFAIGFSLAFLAVWQGNEERRQLTTAVLVSIVAVRLTLAVADFLFSPEAADQRRLVPLDQSGARYFHAASVRSAIVGATVLSAGYLIGIWSGEPYVRLLLLSAAAGIFVAYFAALVWRGRQHVARPWHASAAGGAEPSWSLRVLAQSWAGLVVAYAIVLYLAMVIAALAAAPVSVASYLCALLVVVVALPFADGLVGLFDTSRRRRLPAPGSDTPPQRQSHVFRRSARIILAMLALLLVFRLFGVDLIATANETLGSRAARLAFDIGLIVLVAYVLWELGVAAINRKLDEERAAAAAHGFVATAQASRLSTLLPLLRRALQGAILAIAGLMVLASLGVEIGPLLAGAGIFGLAVGFGAQTLVKDIISGLFFLLDDAFRMGEYIQVGTASGTVERINIRSLALRTPEGAIHTLPFGDMQGVANFSRDWTIVKMEFKVTYDADIAKVKRIFRQIGEELSKDPELASFIIEPFKFQGVKAMEESGIIVRGKFMAVPGTQFQIRKQVFERVRRAFLAEGIDFAQRRVQVDLPATHDHDEATKARISRAAAAAGWADDAPPAAGTGA